MHRHLFIIVAAFTVSACVVEPHSGDRGTLEATYPVPVSPAPSIQGSTPPVDPASFSGRPAAAPWASEPEPYTTASISWPPPPMRQSAGATTYPQRQDIGSAVERIGPEAAYADETVDYGVPPTNTLRLHDFDAPTPTRIEGAHTVTTVELQRMLASDNPPVLIDVIGGRQSVSLPHAVWLRDAGVGRHLDDDVQAWFDLHLSRLTGDDKSHPLVFFCASRMCWLAHNATLRALDLGYRNVSWYRGGRDSWQAAGLPMFPVAPSPFDD